MDRFMLKSAVHIFLMIDNKILLLRRFNTGYEDGNYSVPAGHLDGNEPVTLAAIREVYEECGVTIRPADLQVVGVMHRKSRDERIDFFLASTRWAGEIANSEPNKCDELRWCSLDGLPYNTIPYIRSAIQNYLAGTWFSEYGWS